MSHHWKNPQPPFSYNPRNRWNVNQLQWPNCNLKTSNNTFKVSRIEIYLSERTFVEFAARVFLGVGSENETGSQSTGAWLLGRGWISAVRFTGGRNRGWSSAARSTGCGGGALLPRQTVAPSESGSVDAFFCSVGGVGSAPLVRQSIGLHCCHGAQEIFVFNHQNGVVWLHHCLSLVFCSNFGPFPPVHCRFIAIRHVPTLAGTMLTWCHLNGSEWILDAWLNNYLINYYLN